MAEDKAFKAAVRRSDAAMELIGFDFDKTIYHGNSSVNFFNFCAKRQPRLWRSYARHAGNYILYFFGARTWTETSNSFFKFMEDIEGDRERIVEEFWDSNIDRIKTWFHEYDMDQVIILSGTGEFLLESLAKRIGFKYYLGTIVDVETGEVTGENNTGIHKYDEFCKRYPNTKLIEFYSDSKKDVYLARIAGKAFKVWRNTIKPWPEKQLRKHGR